LRVVALSAIVRNHKEEGIQILTQIRNVSNPDYDPLYDNTIEVCGETMKAGESVVETAIRGCWEEAGCPVSSIIRIVGDNGNIFSTRPDKDRILAFEPYYFVQQLRGPQPWIGPCFVVVVKDGFKPSLTQDKEKEVSSHRWRAPEELLEEARSNPERFMGLHYPFLLKACEDVLAGKITI